MWNKVYLPLCFKFFNVLWDGQVGKHFKQNKYVVLLEALIYEALLSCTHGLYIALLLLRLLYCIQHIICIGNHMDFECNLEIIT